MPIDLKHLYGEQEKPKLTWMFVLAVVLFTLLFSLIYIGLVRAEVLTASWYSKDSLIKEGTWKNGKERRMANNERFNEDNLTGACNLYPLGSMLRVTTIKSNKSIIVRTTDRIGKRFSRTRIDLSKGAFAQIADCKQGLVLVKVERIR